MTLADKINSMISKQALSAYIKSPRFDDYEILNLQEIDTPDLEEDIIAIIESYLSTRKSDEKKEPTAIPATASTASKKDDPDKSRVDELDLKTDEIADNLGQLTKGNVGKVKDMSVQQMDNVQQMAKDPFNFVLSNVFKKFAKGAGLAALATIMFAAVQLILDRLMQPGREFDRTFKRQIRKEILTFTNEREQQELRQGFKSVIVTTRAGLRRSQVLGQISGNFYNPTAISENRLDPRRVEAPFIRAAGAPGNAKFFDRRSR